MTTFIYKFTDAVIETIPNDISVKIVSYLADATDQPFIDSNTQGIDTFTVQTFKSLIPPAANYESWLSITTGGFINEKYNKTTGGSTITGSDIIANIDDTADLGLIPGQYVLGAGIPTDATILVVRDKNSIQISSAATSTQTSVSLTFSSSGWIIDYTEISTLTSLIDFGAL